ncbi:MAG: hypothetical protein SPI88_04435 [Bacilli bacterium]|nr:hypothetical protein [Bacilli bacterium]
MVLEDAERILLKNRPDRTLISSVEYRGLYVFNTVPKKHTTNALLSLPLISVNKKNGEVRTFNPLFDAGPDYKEAVKNIKYYK